MDSGDLFGVGRKARPAKQQKAPVDGPVHELLGIYRDGYTRQFGEPPLVHKSDGKVLRDLVVQFGHEKVRARLLAFLEWDDQYVRENAYALHVFHRQWNRLAAMVVSSAPRQQTRGVPDAKRTDDYLRRLRQS